MEQPLHDINTLTKLKKLCQKLVQKLDFPAIFLLYGNLGSGKTAFVKTLSSLYQIPENKVKSPTFSLINQYRTTNNQIFNHLDLYRLEQVDPILLSEIQEIISLPNSLTFIEWADRLPDHFIQNYSGTIYSLNFAYLPGKYRQLSIDKQLSK